MEADVVCHKSNVKQLYQSQNSKAHALFRPYVGSKGGAVVRALASHQCGPGSNPGVDAICGLSLICCWFSPLLREVFLRVLRFSPLLKNQHFQIPIRSGTHGHV